MISHKTASRVRRPYFGFYPEDWLSSVSIACLTAAQEGGYIRLLCYAWSRDGLPDSLPVLAQLARLSEDDARALLDLFPIDAGDGLRRNPRQEKERRYVDDRREHGAKAAQKRWSMPEKCPSITRAVPEECHSQSQSQSQREEAHTPPAAVASSIPAVVKKPRAAPTGPHAEFIAWWCAAYEQRFGTAYAFQGGKDGEHVKRCLSRLKGDVDELRRRASRLLLKPAEWMAKGGMDLGSLECHLNKLATLDVEPMSTGEMLLFERGLARPKTLTIAAAQNSQGRIEA